LGVEVDESMVVKNVLMSLPMIFDPKISSLEERSYLGTLSMEELHGIFTSYEMRIEREKSITNGTTFKESNKTKKRNNKKSKSGCICSDD
jgi:hypothetical protein